MRPARSVWGAAWVLCLLTAAPTAQPLRRVQDAAVAPSASKVQRYPERPVKIVVPFPPGAIADASARIIARHLSDSWNQPFLIENRPGAASIVGTVAVVKAPADGYVLLYAPTNIATNPSLYAKLQYDAERDLTPVALGILTIGVLVVHPALPASSLGALIALAKQRPGQLTFSSSGPGTFPHLAMEMLKQLAGVDIVHVPYKGLSPAMTAVLAREVDMLMLDVSTALPQLKAGKLRALAISNSRRSQALPEIPTVAELGFSDYEAVGWLGFMAPARTPRQVVLKLNAEINRGLATPEVAAQFSASGVEIRPGTPEDFRAFILQSRARWAKVIQAGAIQGE